MTARILAWFGGITAVVTCCLRHPLDAAVIVKDNFSCVTNGGLVTSSEHYIFTNFPYRGMSGSDNPSKAWDITTGTGRVENAWIHFGSPRQHVDAEYLRCVTRRADFSDVAISWKYRSGPFGGADGHPIVSSHATDVWVRYVTQYDLYVVQFDRQNNRVVAKRKVPALGWSGTNALSNHGAYYVLLTDSENPTGPNNRYVTWASRGLSDLAHDTNTVYEFTVKVITKGEAVQIQLQRDGVFVASWTDQSNGIYEGNQNGETLADHLVRGYYNTVTNWQAEWGRPITRAGSTGFRADNIKIWIDDFEVSSLVTTNDSRISISRQNDKMVLNWTGTTLQYSEDLVTWYDDDCTVSPLFITPAEMKFYRSKSE